MNLNSCQTGEISQSDPFNLFHGIEDSQADRFDMDLDSMLALDH